MTNREASFFLLPKWMNFRQISERPLSPLSAPFSESIFFNSFKLAWWVRIPMTMVTMMTKMTMMAMVTMMSLMIMMNDDGHEYIHIFFHCCLCLLLLYCLAVCLVSCVAFHLSNYCDVGARLSENWKPLQERLETWVCYSCGSVTLGRKLSENGKSAVTSGLLVAHGNLKSFRICLSLKKKKM